MKSLLNNITEFNRLVAGLKEGEVIVTDSSGNMWTGTLPVNGTKNLKPLPVKTVGKTPHDIDSDGIQEFIQTSSWVNAPGKVFKNQWDLIRVKLAKMRDESPMYDLFLDKMESMSSEESALITCDIKEAESYLYYEIKLPNFPIIVGLNKSLKMRYYIYKGEKVLV